MIFFLNGRYEEQTFIPPSPHPPPTPSWCTKRKPRKKLAKESHNFFFCMFVERGSEVLMIDSLGLWLYQWLYFCTRQNPGYVRLWGKKSLHIIWWSVHFSFLGRIKNTETAFQGSRSSLPALCAWLIFSFLRTSPRWELLYDEASVPVETLSGALKLSSSLSARSQPRKEEATEIPISFSA